MTADAVATPSMPGGEIGMMEGQQGHAMELGGAAVEPAVGEHHARSTSAMIAPPPAAAAAAAPLAAAVTTAAVAARERPPFPVYEGQRRRAGPHDPLFEAGDEHRELLAAGSSAGSGGQHGAPSRAPLSESPEPSGLQQAR